MNIRKICAIIDKHDSNRDYLWNVTSEEDCLTLEIILNTGSTQHIIRLPMDATYSFRRRLESNIKILQEIAKVLEKSTEE